MKNPWNMLLILILAVAVLSGCRAIGNQNVTPTQFSDNDIFYLKVNIDPHGAGSINRSVFLYIPGTSTKVTAIANPGYIFDHWSGDASGVSDSFELLMDSDKTITAHFVPDPNAIPTQTLTPMTWYEQIQTQIPTQDPRSSSRSPTSAYTPTPSSRNSLDRAYYNPDLNMNCIFWESITPSMEGEHICVFGRVFSMDFQYNGLYINFKSDGKSFYLILLKDGDQYYYFPALDDYLDHTKPHKPVCVQADGIVKVYANIPRIEIKRLRTFKESVDDYYCGYE